MQELVLVIFMIAAVFSVRLLTEIHVSASFLTQTGLAIFLFGLVEGIPTGFYYHVVLYRTLNGRGKLPRGWWWSPSRYHVHLASEEYRTVRRWYFLGGIGFVLCILGGGLAIAGMVQGFI